MNDDASRIEFDAVAISVRTEEEAQNQKWGMQSHPNGTGKPGSDRQANYSRQTCREAFDAGVGTWAHILIEEVDEALAEVDSDKLRAELIQVAAVAQQWVRDIDHKKAIDEVAHDTLYPKPEYNFWDDRTHE